MEFHKSDRVIKFAYGMHRYPPHQVTLCALFWRVLLIAPLLWIFLGLLLIVLGPGFCVVWLWRKFINKPLKAWWVAREERKYQERRDKCNADPYAWHPPQPTFWATIVAGFKAIKGKYCPIIQIK